MKEKNNLSIRDIRLNRLIPEIVLKCENNPGVIRIPLRDIGKFHGMI
jgi:hypothetical protein